MNKPTGALIKFILAYIVTVIIGVITGYGITRIDILLPLLCIVIYTVSDMVDHKYIHKDNGWDIIRRLGLEGMTYRDACKELKYALPVSVLFSLSVVTGRHIDVWEQIVTAPEPVDIAIFTGLTLLFAGLMIILFKKSDRYGADADMRDASAGRTDVNRISAGSIFKYGALYLICYMPYYLTLFPGNLGKDTFESVDMILGNIPWTNHHPVFFTALMGAVIRLTGWMGSITASLGIFTLLHMMAVCLTQAYITVWIAVREKEAGIKRYISISAAIFFALHPITAMYSMYITKDVLFSCVLVLLVLTILDIRKGTDVNGRLTCRYCVRLGVLQLAVMLLRNNGVFIIALTGICICLVYRKEIIRPALTILLSLVIFISYKTIAYRALDISPESFAESASVPLQQVGYVIVRHDDAKIKEALTPEGYSQLTSIMPLARVREEYELGYTDPYKFSEYFDDGYFNEHKKEFMGIWLRLLPDFFPDYAVAYLAQTAGYWHYGETNTVATQGVWEDNTIGVDRVDVIDNVTGVSLYTVIEKLMLGMRKAPVLCILSSMAMQFYACLVLMSILARRRRSNRESAHIRQETVSAQLAATPLIFLWISIMIATPAFCLFRYTYPFFMLWPVTIYEILMMGKEKKS